MFGPKHTAREAAAILVAGLRDGSIVLRHEDEPPTSALKQQAREILKNTTPGPFDQLKRMNEQIGELKAENKRLRKRR
jgi:hypothetical protein